VKALGFAPASHASHVHSVEELAAPGEDVSEGRPHDRRARGASEERVPSPGEAGGRRDGPLSQVTMLDVRWTPDQNHQAVQESVHTRFPVYEGDTHAHRGDREREGSLLHLHDERADPGRGRDVPTHLGARRSLHRGAAQGIPSHPAGRMAIVVDAVGQPIGSSRSRTSYESWWARSRTSTMCAAYATP